MIVELTFYVDPILLTQYQCFIVARRGCLFRAAPLCRKTSSKCNLYLPAERKYGKSLNKRDATMRLIAHYGTFRKFSLKKNRFVCITEHERPGYTKLFDTVLFLYPWFIILIFLLYKRLSYNTDINKFLLFVSPFFYGVLYFINRNSIAYWPIWLSLGI